MIKLQNRSRPKDQGKFTEIIESEEEPSKEDTEII